MPAVLAAIHLLSCRAQLPVLAATLASWRRSDLVGHPHLHWDAAPEQPGEEWGTAARAARLPAAFARMLRRALHWPGQPEDWLLFLEDDLEFHPRLEARVGAWAALGDERCVLASLFNPSLQATAAWGERPRAFAAEPRTFLGAQALLLRRRVLPEVLAKWDSVPGLTSQRLAALLGARGPVWVHRPSLVQHVAGDSSWGARVQRALDFDPASVA